MISIRYDGIAFNENGLYAMGGRIVEAPICEVWMEKGASPKWCLYRLPRTQEEKEGKTDPPILFTGTLVQCQGEAKRRVEKALKEAFE